MPPGVARFLELATAPLAKRPKPRELAKGELMARLGHRGTPVETIDVEEPVRRLEEAGQWNLTLRRGGLLGLLLVAGGLLLFYGADLVREVTLFDQRRMAAAAELHRWRVPGREPLLFRTVSREAPDLRLGAGDPGGTAALRERFPDDLAILQEHLIRGIDSDGAEWPGLTADEQALIDRSDPDNALWPLILLEWRMARAAAEVAAVRVPRGSRSASRPITEEADFKEALELFHLAADADHYTDHSMHFARQQIGSFPTAGSLVEDQIRRSFAGLPRSRVTNSHLAYLLSSRAEQLEGDDERQGLVMFSQAYRRLLRLVVEGDLRPERGAQLEVLASVLPAMRGSLHLTGTSVVGTGLPHVGLSAESAAFDEIDRAFLSVENSTAANRPALWRHAGIRVQDLQYEIPLVDIRLEELKPSRMAEAAVTDRIGAIAGAVLCFGMVLLCGFEISRRPKVVRGLAEGVMPLIRRSDHLWIGALGIVVPWLWWWSVTRLTPLGLRDIGLYQWDLLPWALQSALGWLFGVQMIVQTAYWRWSNRGGFLGVRHRFLPAGWLAAAITALALPTVGWVRYLGGSEDKQYFFMLTAAAAGSLGLLALLWVGLTNLFMPINGALQPNLIARTALPWFLAAALSLLIAVPVLSSAERRWMARDTLVSVASSETHLDGLHERAAAAIRTRLIPALAP